MRMGGMQMGMQGMQMGMGMQQMGMGMMGQRGGEGASFSVPVVLLLGDLFSVRVVTYTTPLRV